MADFKLVGAVAIKVRPDTRKFRKETQVGVSKALAGFDADVEIKADVKLDTARAKAEAKKLEAEESGKTIEWKVKYDHDSVRAAKAQFDKLFEPTKLVKFDLDDQGSIDKAAAKLDKMLKNAKVKMTYEQDEKGYQSVLDKIAAIRREKLEKKITFTTDDAELDRIEAKMRKKIARQAAKVVPVKQTVTLTYNENREGLTKAIAQIDAELEKLDAITLPIELDREHLLAERAKLQDRLDQEPLIFRYAEDEEGFKSVLSKIKEIRRQRAEVPVDLNLSDEELDRLEREIRDKLNNVLVTDLPTTHMVKIDFNRNESGLKKAIAQIDAELEKINAVQIEVELDKESLEAARALAQAELDNLPAEVMFTPDEQGWREVLARIKQIQRTRLEVPIDLNLSADELAAKRAEIEGILDDLTREREVKLRLAETDRLKVEHEVQSLKDMIDGMKGTMQVDLAGTLAVAARLAYLGRDRIVTYFAKVSMRSVALVEGTLKSLAGLNILHSATDMLERLFTRFDSIALKIGTITTLIGNLANVAISATAGLFAVGDGVFKSIGLLALAPTVLGSLFTTLLIGQTVFKDFGAAIHGIDAALKRLPPSGQAAAKIFRTVFAEVRESVSKQFWDNASDSMLHFAEHTLPVFSRGLSGVAAELGSVFGGILDSFTNLSLAGGLDTMFANLVQMFKNLSKGATAFWDALNIIGLRGSEFLPQFGTWLTKISVQFKDWADRSSKNGDLTRWIEEGVVSLKEMWKIGGDVIDIFKAISGAALAAGAGGLGTFQMNLRRIADEMNSSAWQAKAANLFKGAREGAHELNAGFKDLKHSIGESSQEFGNMLRLFGSIGGGLLSNIGLIFGNQNFQDGATASLEGLQRMMETLRPGAVALANIIGNIDRIAGVAFSNLGTLLSRMLVLVDTAFAKIADGLAMVTPRLMNTVGSLFLAAAPAVIALADALKAVLDIVNLVPGGFVAAGVAATVFFALRALGSKFFDKLQMTNYFKTLQTGWAQQQIAAGKTMKVYREVDGVFKKVTVPTEKFRATSAVFRDLSSSAGQTAGSLRAMYAIAAQTPQKLGPMASVALTARSAFSNWGAALGLTAKELGSFYGSMRVGASTINPQNEALLRNRAAALGIIGPQAQMAGQFRTSAGAIKDGTGALRIMTPAMAGLRPAFSQVASAAGTTAGQLRTMYGMFRAVPATLTPFNTAMKVAGTAVGATAKAVGGGLLSLLGGPWGIAFLAAGAAVAVFAQKQQDAQALTDGFTATLDKQTGAMTANTTAFIANNIVAQKNNGLWLTNTGAKSASETIEKLGLKIQTVADITAKGGDDYTRMIELFQEGADALAASQPVWEADGKIKEGSSEALDKWLEKMQLAPGVISQFDLTGVIAFLNGQRGAQDGSRDAILKANDAMDAGKIRTDNFNDAMRIFNDTVSTGDAKLRALNTAIGLLNGTPLDLEDAKASVNASVRSATSEWQEFSEVVDGKLVKSMKLVGGAFRDANGNIMDFKNVINPVTGEISTVGIAGAKLYDTLRPIAEGTKSVATEMKTAKQPIADIATYLDKQRANFVKLGTDAGLSKELVERAYDHMIGANPKELITLIKAEGINEANEKLKNYKGTLDEVDAYHAVADIAGDDKVLGVKLADAYTDLNAWDKAVGTAQAGLDPKEADAVRKRLLLDLFNLAQTNPTVRANMDPRLLNEVLADANKDLDELEKRKPSPLVSAQIEEAKRRIQTIMDMMWNLDHHRATAIVSVQTVYTTKGTPAPQGFVVRPGDPMPNANGNILNGAGRVVKHFANGGIERHVAQITKPGSPMRVWSEPETQGEAYLPYAMSKRPRSVAILAQVAKDFGYTINRAEQFANGGITGSTSTSHTSADVHIGSITTVDMHQAVAKLRQSQRDALAVAGISSIGV